MFKCEICNKEFYNIMSLSGHKSHHVKRNGLDILKTKERTKKQKDANILKYLENPEKCAECNIIIEYNRYLQKTADRKRQLKSGKLIYNFFCSSSCAASFNNKKRERTEHFKNKVSESLKEFHKNKNKPVFLETLKGKRKHKKDYVFKTEIKEYLKDIKIELTCPICTKTFITTKNKIRKNCSIECRNLGYSLNRQKYLNERGNFSTPRELFMYKNISIEVDSNLEKAGIVYLIDTLNATNIERYKNILTYNDGKTNRTYNPDFICYINNETYIVEIKQPWTSKVDHLYNTSIPFKKKVLEDYCIKNNFKYLWMDFNTTPELKSIYKTILKNRK